MNVRGLVSQFDLSASEVVQALRIQRGQTASAEASSKPLDRGANGAAVVRRSLGRKRCASG